MLARREQLDPVHGKMTLLRRLEALRPGPLTSTLALARASLRAIARRWLTLDAEIKQHDVQLEILTAARAPEMLQAHGMATSPASEMLLVGGDNHERIRSEAALLVAIAYRSAIQSSAASAPAETTVISTFAKPETRIGRKPFETT